MQENPNPAKEIELPGLTSVDAARRLAEFGPNEFGKVQKTRKIVRFLKLLLEPLMLILLIASAVSLFVGEIINAVIMALMVTLSAALNFIQTTRSETAAERLREKIAPMATVRRDGVWKEVARREVVTEDVIRVIAGDLVPADAKLLSAIDLHLQEASLTGESLPVHKQSDAEIYLGTSVVSGSGEALVTATGGDTTYGKIAARLEEKPPETDFEHGTRKFGLLIARLIFFLVVFVFIVNTFAGRQPLEALFFSIALAVGLTPEFLPMIMTITLGRGAALMAKKNVIVKHLAAIQNFGSMDILCSDKTGTITEGKLNLLEHLDPLGEDSERAFALGYINSRLQTGVENPIDRAIVSLNPLDQAILEHGDPDISAVKKIGEVPFDFERRRMSVVVESDGRSMLITKGAPESVLEICESVETSGRVEPLTKKLRAEGLGVYESASAKGIRVLAVAYKYTDVRDSFAIADEAGLTFAGFLNFADEPLESARSTLKKLAADGVTVKILTGDSELVAKHVCGSVGLDGQRIVLGSDLDHVSDDALGSLAESTSVFARVSPMQKNRIILALKARGHVVGFMGDGINDAPSLRSADVGISVSTAADVAKDASEIVLLERGLGVLHAGIIEGRKSFGNVMKYLLMGTSSNFGNMFSMAGAALFLPFLPMLPTQILLNNFLYDLAQITIPTDNVDPTFIRKPHRWDVKVIRDFMIVIGPISSIYDFLTFYILLHYFQAGEQLFQTGWFIESLATQTLVVFVIRTASSPWKNRPSRSLALAVIAVVAIAIAIPFSPIGGYFGFVPPPPTFFAFLVAATVTYLILVETVKRRLMRRLIG
ncbi:MAG: magnesium-translocating P-type ATPase [Acidobacteria bacterium]|nr:magnesium-translocating P-type ATPase [Acidobacteriota bacterium]